MTRFRLAIAAPMILVVTALAASCTPPTIPAPPSENFRLTAVTHHNLNQNEFTTVINELDEPYLLQVGFSVKLGVPGSATTFSVEDYPHEICQSGDGIPQPGILHADHHGPTSCAVPTAQGRVSLPPVQRLDVIDVLAQTAPLQIEGAVTIAMEEDQLIPIGPLTQLHAIEDALKTILNDTVAAGTVPTTQDALRDLIRSVIGDALQFIGGQALSFLGGFGNRDDRIGVGATFLVGARGTLANILRPLLGNVAVATTVAGTSLKARSGVLEPQTFSLDYHADSGAIGNLFGGDTDYRYDFAVTQV